MSSANPRIAIIGGGCAAMAAAYELTHGANEGRFDVTVYQMGWRLGGKGASGRGIGGRIEEHGLHLWMGHYDNAFSLMRRCYHDLGLNWRDAFTPAPDVGLMHPATGGGWETLLACFPPMPGTPGDPRQEGFSDYVGRALKLLLELLRAAENVERASINSVTPQLKTVNADADTRAAWRQVLSYAELGALTAALHGLSLLQIALRADSRPGSINTILTNSLEEIGTSLHNLLETVLTRDTASRYLWEIIDVVLAQIRGGARMVRDSLTLEDINAYDIREWLLLNGATESSMESSFVRGLYDLAFAYEDGDPEKPGIAAGEGLIGSIRMFLTYRESLFWKMQGGMGDVVFVPLYQELRDKGVRFEFFHRLENVGIFANEAPQSRDTFHVESLTFTQQARVLNGGEYQPLSDFDGDSCWPVEPLWEQLEDGSRLRSMNIEFESPDSPGVNERKLRVGVDFDLVVLGISIGSIPKTCSELIAVDDRWRQMASHVKTVPTQSLQLWLNEDLEALGWSDAPPSVSAFITPFDTWADMTHLAPIENWPEAAKTIGYFCSVYPDGDSAPAAAANVRKNAVDFLNRHIHHLWPNAVGEAGFRWELLAAAPGGVDVSESESEPIDTQYWRANVHPSDRYVLSLPGTIQYRISPLDGACDNLTICGDWTDCGFNLGCVEAAVMSGRLAAHALSLHPELSEIAGYDLF